jgi:hypothetical protein
LAYNNFLISNQKKNSILANDIALAKELGFELFSFSKEDFEKNVFLERDLRNLFKKLNKESKKTSIYDLKYYYLFFYNIYVEEKIIIPLFYLNERSKYVEEEDDTETDSINHISNVRNLITFDSLYEKFNIEVFRNNIDLMYTYIYNLKNNNEDIDESIEKKIKTQVIYYNFIKKYLKCNKVTFLIITKLL